MHEQPRILRSADLLIVRWLHRVIVYCVVCTIVMIRMPFLRLLFTLFPPSVFTRNKQCLNSGFLSSSLKLWVLVLNYQCPNKCVFYLLMALAVIIFNFLWWNLPKFSQQIASSRLRILNMKKVGFVRAGFSSFATLSLLPLQKTGLIRFPWKTSSD